VARRAKRGGSAAAKTARDVSASSSIVARAHANAQAALARGDRDAELERFDNEANRALVDDDLPERETRGDKKRRAEQLERLGVEIVKLPLTKIARLPLPDDLREAVLEAKRISAHGGYRRQIQFIGRIMRGIDATPIAAALDGMKQEDAPSAASFKAAERWRDRLIDQGDAALEALVGEHPGADRTTLRQLMRQAVTEKAKKKPPHASRALFRALHTLFQAATQTPNDDESGNDDDDDE